MKMHKYLAVIFVLALSPPSFSQSGTFYKCKDADGRITYADKPCFNADVEAIEARPLAGTFDGSYFSREAERQKNLRDRKRAQRKSESQRIQLELSGKLPADEYKQETSPACQQAPEELKLAKHAAPPDRQNIAKKQRALAAACAPSYRESKPIDEAEE